jgi:hypothetical protein
VKCSIGCFFWVFQRRLLILHASVVSLNVRIALALDARLFVANGVSDLLGLLYRTLTNGDLSRLHGLLGDIDLFRAHGNADSLALANGGVRDLTRASAALDVDFLVGYRDIKGLLLGDDFFSAGPPRRSGPVLWSPAGALP